jgi:hypothetical protein
MQSLSWLNRLQIERCVERNRTDIKMQQKTVDNSQFFVDNLSNCCPQIGISADFAKNMAVFDGGGRGRRATGQLASAKLPSLPNGWFLALGGLEC